MSARRFPLAFLAVSIFLVLGCSRVPRVKILFMPGVADAFYSTMEAGMRKEALRLGADLVVAEYPGVWGPDHQIPLLEHAVAREKFDVLLIAPTSTSALVAPLRAIHETGTRIITVDTFIGDGDYSRDSEFSFPLSFIGSDNRLGGRLMAEHLATLVGERGRVFCQATNPDVSSIRDRVEGFIAGIAEFPNMELAGTEWCQDIQERAEGQTLGALMEFGNIVGIFGVNVFSAQGSYLAVVDAGLAGAVRICSWDATLELIAALRKGQVDLVLAQKPGEMGSLAVEWAVKSVSDLESAAVPKKITTGFEFFSGDNVNDPAMQQFIYR